MSGGMWVAASGLQAANWAVDALANDVANVDTAGFKAMVPDVSSLAPGSLYPAGLAGGPAVQPQVLGGGGAAPLVLELVDTQGPLRQTGRPLDLAINGNGYFAVRAAAGVRYTRAGAFGLDANGVIVDGQGHPLLDVAGQPLTVPTGASGVRVDGAGVVSAEIAGKPQTVGRIGVALIPDPQRLQGRPGGNWAAPAAAGAVATVAPGSGGAGDLAAGYLEDSNVSLAQALPDLIAAERAYQLNAQALAASNTLATKTDQLTL